MNDTFNFKRFSLLFLKQTTEHYKTWLMAFFVLMGMLFLSMGYIGFNSLGLGVTTQEAFFLFFLLLGGGIFTSIIFKDLGNKMKAISLLTIPASHLEKYLVAWVYTFIIFPVIFVPSFHLIARLINLVASIEFGIEQAEYLSLFDRAKNEYRVFLFYALIHSIALWGSLFFRKNHFIKTAFALFIGSIIISTLNKQFLRLLTDENINSSAPFSGLYMTTQGANWAVHLSEQGTILYSVMATMTILLWLVSFYRLKEREV